MTNRQFAALFVCVAAVMIGVTAGAQRLNADRVVEPLDVLVQGPVDAIVGDLVTLRAIAQGDARSFAWSIEPATPGFVVRGDTASFTNRHRGRYRVTVSVADGGGHSAHTWHEFELLPLAETDVVSLEDLIAPPQPLDVGQLVRQWVAEVQSPTRDTEAAILAGTLREIGNLAASGQLAEGSDPLAELERAAEVAVGPDVFARWGTFFTRLRLFVGPLHQAGAVDDNLEFGTLFNNLATIMDAAVGR